MNSLFAKILAWFLAALIITAIGFGVITGLTLVSAERQPLLGRLLAVQAKEARHAWETGGPAALIALLRRLEESFEGSASLTGPAGRDLVTGEDRTALIRAARVGAFIPPFHRNRLVFVRREPPYWFILEVPRNRVGAWIFFPQHFWVLAAAVLLCYLLARHLTQPVRQLQRAVERFARGDLTARVRSARKDELGDLARTFDHMAGRIESLMAAERQLLLDISHELRSPLARLSVAVELARAGGDQQATLDRIQKEADRLNALVGGLLQVTRAEVDPGSRRREPVDLGALLASIAADVRIEAEIRGVRFTVAVQPGATVEGDPELLRRAFENVIRNAVRYAPERSEVAIECEAATVRVRDHGPGVPEAALGRIFDPFYRVGEDRGRASGGAGLGLSIARRAIELHGGSVTARNADPGLEVTLRLPV